MFDIWLGVQSDREIGIEYDAQFLAQGKWVAPSAEVEKKFEWEGGEFKFTYNSKVPVGYPVDQEVWEEVWQKYEVREGDCSHVEE